MKFFHISIYFTILFKCTASIQLSSSTTKWHDAEKACEELETMYNFAGSTVFLTDTGSYDPNRVSRFNLSVFNGSSPVWVHAYRQTSIWIAHEGCSYLPLRDLNSEQNNFYLNMNSPGECYFACKNMKNIKRMAMHNRTCYCVSDDSVKSLLQSNKALLASCGYKCPGDSLYYCGGDSEGKDEVYLSVYQTLTTSSTGYEEDQNCHDSSERSVDCDEKWSCFCGDRDNTNITELTSVTWEECNHNCSSLSKKVVIIDLLSKPGLTLKENVTYWTGYFRIMKDVWSTSLKSSEKKDTKCLALNQSIDGSFTFVSLDCNEKLLALCYKGLTNDAFTTDLSTINQSNPESPITLSTETMVLTTAIMPQSSEHQYTEQEMDTPGMALLAGTIAGSVGLVTVVIVISVCIHKKRKRPTKESLSVTYTGENKPNNTDLHYEAVISEDEQNDTNKMEQNMNEDTDYDHLHTNRHDVKSPKQNENLYDHTGIKTEDFYDLTNNTKLKNAHDGDNVNEYDTFRSNDESEYDKIIGDSVKKTKNESEYTL